MILLFLHPSLLYYLILFPFTTFVTDKENYTSYHPVADHCNPRSDNAQFEYVYENVCRTDSEKEH